MERNIDSLIGYSIEATDGEIGKVEDFYFDDETWTIRYLVVETGGWLSGRKVLISPAAFTGSNIKVDLFPVNLTMEQIRTSPDIDTDKPVSRQKEAMLNKHHFWQNYWGSGSYAGEMSIPNKRPIVIKDADRDPADDAHLRSIKQVGGYAIHALDGEIGHVNNLIVDDKTWELKDLIVDTHNWIGGKKVLIPITNVDSVSFVTLSVYLNIKIADVTDSKLYEDAEYSPVAG
jgi:sporulation protein YlmC with PRC-barrel domain